MKKRHGRFLASAAGLFAGLILAFPAYAESISGQLHPTDSPAVQGWVLDEDAPDQTLSVEFHVTEEESGVRIGVFSAIANNDQEQLNEGQGSHGFTRTIRWSELEGERFLIQAYAVSKESKTAFGDTLLFDKATGVTTVYGPGSEPAAKKEVPPVSEKNAAAAPEEASENQGPKEAPESAGTKGQSLGLFTTTGYCSCTKCTNGEGITYNGSAPRAAHTISADINVFPIGTKLMIGDIIYTVEDIGSGVDGRKLDIYYPTHAEAYAHGVQTQEVFSVE